MYKYHPEFETPESTTQLWRYINFESFVWIIQHSSIWFSQADFFEDKWEGAYPIPSINALKEEIKEYPDGIATNMWEGLKLRNEQIKKTIYINCWYASNYESSAMWQIYAGAGNTIAIRTTVGKLTRSIANDTKNIHVGRIKYIDYQKDTLSNDNLFLPYLRKRISFAHESEVRLIMWSLEAGNNPEGNTRTAIENALSGYAINVNLNDLIDTVFISPKAKPWFLDLVRDVLKTYQYENIRIEQSDFDKSPPL